jgi:hypothetical protein
MRRGLNPTEIETLEAGTELCFTPVRCARNAIYTAPETPSDMGTRTAPRADGKIGEG